MTRNGGGAQMMVMCVRQRKPVAWATPSPPPTPSPAGDGVEAVYQVLSEMENDLVLQAKTATLGADFGWMSGTHDALHRFRAALETKETT